jgi:hypothetical protein
MLSWRGKKLVVVLVLTATPLIAAGAAALTAPDERAERCGAGRAGNSPIGQFDIPRAAAVRDVLPGMRPNPELVSDPRPAHVVVFGDGFVPPPIAGPGEYPKSVSSAVCVIKEDGELILYVDVSLEGFASSPD